jgi:hypothetical protein
MPKPVLLPRILLTNTIAAFCPKSAQSHHLCLNFYSSKHTRTKGKRDFKLELEGGRAHNNAHTKRHTAPLPPIDRLSVLYPLIPSLTLTLHHVQRCHTERDAQSGLPAAAPTAKTKRGGRATFLRPTTKKRGKQRIFCFSLRERNKQNPTKYITNMF